MKLTAQQSAFLANPSSQESLRWLSLDEPHRRSGRTTAMALLILRQAWERPGQWLPVVDHASNTLDQRRACLDVIENLAQQAEARAFMEFDKVRLSVRVVPFEAARTRVQQLGVEDTFVEPSRKMVG